MTALQLVSLNRGGHILHNQGKPVGGLIIVRIQRVWRDAPRYLREGAIEEHFALVVVEHFCRGEAGLTRRWKLANQRFGRAGAGFGVFENEAHILPDLAGADRFGGQ